MRQTQEFAGDKAVPNEDALLYDQTDDHVATVTLNRPEALNALSTRMRQEFKEIWARIRQDDSVHAVVLRAAPGRAFSTGVDQIEPRKPSTNPWNFEDPGDSLCPKHNECWKPLVTAVHGMAAGGAFYFLNESDIVICSEDATFFDPHTTYGMTSALEPIGMTYKMLLGDVLRMVLLGNDERINAHSAMRMGIVSEVVSHEKLWDRAHEIAAKIASKPTAATQGSVKAIWQSLDMGRAAALATGLKYCQIGNPLGIPQVDRGAVMAAVKKFDVR
jgi:enoyl-CoA hydratase/carnithine racemase